MSSASGFGPRSGSSPMMKAEEEGISTLSSST
jgi:hypothetical protein